VSLRKITNHGLHERKRLKDQSSVFCRAVRSKSDKPTNTKGGGQIKEMKLMIDLPHYFLVSPLNDWLGVKGTMTLDRAMSDREQRAVLLEILRSGDVCFEVAKIVRHEEGVINDEESNFPYNSLYWLWLRGVGVRHVFVWVWECR
jgi:hypothetical protein